jgi:hypothetical protein
LDLEATNGCTFDYIMIYDGPTRNSPLLKRFCSQSQEQIISTGSSMLVVFRTDYSQGGRGFHARYFMGRLFLTLSFYK